MLSSSSKLYYYYYYYYYCYRVGEIYAAADEIAQRGRQTPPLEAIRHTLSTALREWRERRKQLEQAAARSSAELPPALAVQLQDFNSSLWSAADLANKRIEAEREQLAAGDNGLLILSNGLCPRRARLWSVRHWPVALLRDCGAGALGRGRRWLGAAASMPRWTSPTAPCPARGAA